MVTSVFLIDSKSEPGWSSSSSAAAAAFATSACSCLSRVSATFCLSFSLSAFLSFLSFFLSTRSVLSFFSFFSFLSFLALWSSDAIVTGGCGRRVVGGEDGREWRMRETVLELQDDTRMRAFRRGG